MTANEFTALAEFVGWYDYESYIADATKLIPDGEYGLNLMNGGHRGSDGAFSESTVFHLIDNDFGYTAMNFFNSSEVWVIQKDMSYLNKDGLYVILVKDSTSLADGETSSLTDVDGNIIPTICIDGVEFTSQNWKSTKLADGTPIPEVTDNSAWAALITGALCAYDNDWDNV
ncbi:MAG: hypothetical protein FD166_2731 [Bacteroidetes bacterium]|nr:MAG: hypothetical protein FD166_2731 [Bacteroidota bacterium]